MCAHSKLIACYYPKSIIIKYYQPEDIGVRVRSDVAIEVGWQGTNIWDRIHVNDWMVTSHFLGFLGA